MADAGLDMDGYNITRDDTGGFTLDLFDGTSDGSITNGGTLSTLSDTGDMNSRSGDMQISNVVDVSVAAINTQAKGIHVSGRIYIEQTGDLRVAGDLKAYPDSVGNSGSGGRIDLIGAGGTEGAPSGILQIGGSIRNSARTPKSINIRGYNAVEIAGSVNSSRTTNVPESDESYSARIVNIGAGGVSIANHILLHSPLTDNEGRSSARNVDIVTAGAVSVGGNILTYTSTDYIHYPAGTITICATNDIDVGGNLDTRSRSESSQTSRNSGDIILTSASGNVTVSGNIDTRLTTTQSTSRAGNLTITAEGDIELSGWVNLLADTLARSGNIALTTTGLKSTITVASLELANVQSAQFDAPDGSITLIGLLTGTDGNPASGLGNIGTRLRVPDGQAIRYDPSENPSLNKGIYRLADLAGNAGDGGELRPFPQGTVVVIR